MELQRLVIALTSALGLLFAQACGPAAPETPPKPPTPSAPSTPPLQDAQPSPTAPTEAPPVAAVPTPSTPEASPTEAEAEPAHPTGPVLPPEAPREIAPIEPPAQGDARTLYDRLVAEVGAGRPVAILPWFEGLVAVSADGARMRGLVPGPIAWALVDERARAVWFGRAVAEREDVTIEVIDLLASQPEPRLIADQLGDHYVQIAYPGDPAPGDLAWIDLEMVGTMGPNLMIKVVLDPKRPRFELEPSVYMAMGIEDGAELARTLRRRQPTREAREVLEALAARAVGRRMFLPTPQGPELPPLDLPGARCEGSQELCGSVTPIPGTPLWSVIVGQACGDACTTISNAYDPRTRRFVDLLDPARSSPSPLGDDSALETLFIAADGTALISGVAIARVDSAPTLPYRPEAGYYPRGGGWLGGQRYAR